MIFCLLAGLVALGFSLGLTVGPRDLFLGSCSGKSLLLRQKWGPSVVITDFKVCCLLVFSLKK